MIIFGKVNLKWELFLKNIFPIKSLLSLRKKEKKKRKKERKRKKEKEKVRLIIFSYHKANPLNAVYIMKMSFHGTVILSFTSTAIPTINSKFSQMYFEYVIILLILFLLWCFLFKTVLNVQSLKPSKTVRTLGRLNISPCHFPDFVSTILQLKPLRLRDMEHSNS